MVSGNGALGVLVVLEGAGGYGTVAVLRASLLPGQVPWARPSLPATGPSRVRVGRASHRSLTGDRGRPRGTGWTGGKVQCGRVERQSECLWSRRE